MPDRETTCCFSGHRPTKLPWCANETAEACIAVKHEILCRLEGIYEAGYRHFICGMALGCDMYFAEAVLELKGKYDDITLEAAIPCATQPDRWQSAQKDRYRRIADACDKVTILQEEYSADCMMRRNKYMVDNSSLLLTCFNGYPGGTMNTIVYAQRSGVKVVTIDI